MIDSKIEIKQSQNSKLFFDSNNLKWKRICAEGKIKCEATKRWLCAFELPLFLFYRSDSQNGFADLRSDTVSSLQIVSSERHGLRITKKGLKKFLKRGIRCTTVCLRTTV